MRNQTIGYFEKIVRETKELSRKEKEILIKRLNANTLGVIGKKYRVTAERIRQIEEKALKKITDVFCQLMLFE